MFSISSVLASRFRTPSSGRYRWTHRSLGNSGCHSCTNPRSTAHTRTASSCLVNYRPVDQRWSCEYTGYATLLTRTGTAGQPWCASWWWTRTPCGSPPDCGTTDMWPSSDRVQHSAPSPDALQVDNNTFDAVFGIAYRTHDVNCWYLWMDILIFQAPMPYLII